MIRMPWTHVVGVDCWMDTQTRVQGFDSPLFAAAHVCGPIDGWILSFISSECDLHGRPNVRLSMLRHHCTVLAGRTAANGWMHSPPYANGNMHQWYHMAGLDRLIRWRTQEDIFSIDCV